VRDPFLPLAATAAILLLAGAAMMCLKRGKAANKTTASRKTWLRIVQFAAATAVVMLPLWIMGKAVLARELVPALQSPLLVPHVGAYMVAYAFLLFAAFGIGARFVPFGYFMMTLALVLGAVWGKICWGDWWQYDPKEMWSLATWIVFGAYFHFRHRPTAAKWLLRAGAALIILTLTWVNFSKLFTGLHSYA
jgi:ABC-type transport system involved in cytochrome c biogenesis permease subunit